MSIKPKHLLKIYLGKIERGVRVYKLSLQFLIKFITVGMEKAGRTTNILNSKIYIRVGKNIPSKLLEMKRTKKYIAKDINQ